MNNDKKEYLGSKYSEHLFAQSGGHLSDEEKEKQNKEFESSKSFEEDLLWKQIDSDDYTKTMTLSIMN